MGDRNRQDSAFVAGCVSEENDAACSIFDAVNADLVCFVGIAEELSGTGKASGVLVEAQWFPSAEEAIAPGSVLFFEAPLFDCTAGKSIRGFTLFSTTKPPIVESLPDLKVPFP